MEKRYWNEYQKEIADDRYFFERSCIRQTFFPGSENAFTTILPHWQHLSCRSLMLQNLPLYAFPSIHFFSCTVSLFRPSASRAWYSSHILNCFPVLGLITPILKSQTMKARSSGYPPHASSPAPPHVSSSPLPHVLP